MCGNLTKNLGQSEKSLHIIGLQPNEESETTMVLAVEIPLYCKRQVVFYNICLNLKL